MRRIEGEFVSPVDGARLATYVWEPAPGKPRGAVQIIHSAVDHALTYEDLAERLAVVGYRVYAHDHRGHGASLQAGLQAGESGRGDPGNDDLGNDEPRNDASRDDVSLTAAAAPERAAAVSLSDIIVDAGAFGGVVQAENPSLPIFVLGHSVGAFIAQHLVIDYPQRYRGLAMSGATALDVLAASGARGGGLEQGGGVGAVPSPKVTENWVRHVTEAAQQYLDDPLVLDAMPERTFTELMQTAGRLSDPDELMKLRPDLSALFISGRDDPFSGDGQVVALLAQRYRAAGLIDVAVNIYPDTGHHVFLDRHRDNAVADFITWLRSCDDDRH